MKFLKESYKGLLFLAAMFTINAVLWLTANPLFAQPIESTVSQILGATLLVSFSLVFFLSTKNRFVNWLFGGLEHVYSTHRWLAILSVAFIFVHGQFANLIVWYYRDVPINPSDLGPLARNIFIALVVLALLAKYMRYERWRMIHRLMIVPYLLAFYHGVFLSSYDLISFTPLGVWTMSVGALGVLSSFYMIFLYRKTAFSYHGTVVSKTYMADNVTELEIEMQKPYAFKTGQFAFFRIKRSPFRGVPHPFTISGAKGNRVFFTIKALGDFTAEIREELAEGDAVELTRPNGHMTFEDYPTPQVWIAGGIGVTPFLSHLRTKDKLEGKITLYYSVRKKEEAVHLDFFKQLAEKHENFHFVFSESDKDGFLSVDDFDLSDNPHVMMCGPVPMAKVLKKQFAKTDKHASLTYEAFSFTGTLAEDAVHQTKRLFKKMRMKFSK